MIRVSAVLKDGYRYNSSCSTPSRSPNAKGGPTNCVVDSVMDDDSWKSAQPTPSKTYLTSPIRTLCESLNDPGELFISTHDVLEAYNILSTRIRLLNETPNTTTLPCLSVIAEHEAGIVQCISRDIQCLLPSPFDSQPQEYSIDVSMDSDDIQMIVDNISLCQYALRFASDVFAFPMLYSRFSDESLISLFRDTLSLCNTALRAPNMDKARVMVVWILKMQQLPTPTLLPLKFYILSTLRYGLSSTSKTKQDALMAIYNLASRHPLLVDSLVELLEPVLNHLTAASLDLRVHASLALCGFAVAKLKSEDGKPYPREKTTDVVCTYIKRDTARSKFSGPDNRLPGVLKSALSGDESWQGHGPAFAMTVVSSILVLVDRFLWTTPRALKLLVNTIAQFAGQKRAHVRAVHPELWRVLVWACARLPTGNVPLNSQDSTDTDAARSVRESAYSILLQERRNGLPVDVAYALLCPGNGEARSLSDVKKALPLLRDMVGSSDVTATEDGRKLLERLLADMKRHPAAPAHDRRTFSWVLVDGSLAKTKANDLRIRPFTVDIDEIPSLSEEEVVEHWDELSQSWAKAARNCIDSDQDLSAGLLGAWQTLLLARGHLVHSGQHFTAPPPVASAISTILNGFLTFPSPAEGPAPAPEAQARCFTLLLRLWGVLTNVFTREWLASPAQSILPTLLKTEITEEHVGDAWARVCAEVAAAGLDSARLLEDLEARAASQEAWGAARQLWRMVAGSGQFVVEDASLKDNLRLLAIPIGAWEISPADFEIWAHVLDNALDIGRRDHQSQHTVLSQFVELVDGSPSKIDVLKTDLRTLDCMLARSLPASASQVDRRLLALLDEALKGCYHAISGDDEKLECVLRMLRSLGEVLAPTSPSEIVGFLSMLQGSLSCWITDDREVLRHDLHDEVVANLYKRPLELLSKVEPSASILTDTADFLQSIFLHIRGDGVLAFNAFWRATYHTRKDIAKDTYPSQIKACLKAWSAFCDDSLADDIDESQSQSVVVSDYSVPDSQLAQSISLGGGGYTQEYEAIFGVQIASAANSFGLGATTSQTPTPRVLALDVPAPASTSICASSAKTGGDMLQPLSGRSARYSASDGEDNGVGAASSTSKRASQDPETPPSTKRRRIETPRSSLARRAGKDAVRQSEPGSSRKAGASMLLASVSEPVSRTPSPLPYPSASASQPSQAYSRFSHGVRASEVRRAAQEEEGFSRLEMHSSDDYDTWEQAISVEDLREVQIEHGEHSNYFASDSRHVPESDGENNDTEPTSDQDDSDQNVLESLSLGQYPAQPRMRYRSQTAPEPGSHANHLQPSKPLRRQQTSPGPGHKKTLSASLDALRHAYAALADMSGISQIDMEEIMQARRLANQINQVLDEQICSKITSSRPRTPDER